jgi:dipeptidyl aminopeptidase/acylaminoacyl peptidase
MMNKLFYFFLASILLESTPCFAHKRPIDEDAYKGWKTIHEPKMSPNGQWVAYTYSYLNYKEQPESGTSTILLNPGTGKEIRLEGVNQLSFLDKGRWICYNQTMDQKTVRILKCLKTGEEIHWNRSVYFQEAPGSPVISYSYTPAKKDYAGRKLTLYNIEKKDSICYENILSYKLFNNNSALVYIRKEQDSDCLVAEQKLNHPNIIFKAGKGRLNQLSLNPSKQNGTFLLTDENQNPKALYEFSLISSHVRLRIDFDNVPRPVEGYSMERSTYSTNGVSVIFPYLSSNDKNNKFSPPQTDESGVDIWKWNEGTMARREQKIRGNAQRSLPPKFAYLIDDNRFTQITQKSEEQLIKPTAGDFHYVFAIDPQPYSIDLDWTFEQFYDIYIIDVYTGKRRQILKKTTDLPQWSPDGRTAVIFNSTDRIWEKIDFSGDSIRFVNLCKGIQYPLFNEDFDIPLSVPAYGPAGWMDNNQALIVYDRYDIWVLDINNRQKPRLLTNGYGRSHGIQLRQLNGYNSNLNEKNVIYLRAYNENTKSAGICQLKNQKVTRLIDGDFNVKIQSIADDSSAVLWTRESYGQCPDLWWSNARFSKPVRVSNINPQQDELNWGKTETIQWTSQNGEQNEGLLFLPENYDPGKKYPTIVYFYEKSTNERYTFKYPDYSESSLNIPTYVSNGYIIFQPDIHFKIGHTGESSAEIIISGTKKLIEEGIADPKHIGIHGHSFGAYQTAFITTQTNMFACSVPASVVTNLTSNYTALRSNGLATMFMYESGQMRMGKPLFDDWDNYLKNSTIFHVKNIETPMLIFHCDNDLTVPFHEGMALFLSLRRMHKPAWLINYKGQAHDLTNMAARIDWTHRLQDFFDYYLKDGPCPAWMK